MRNFQKCLLLFCCLLFAFQFTFAQKKTISIQVSEKKKKKVIEGLLKIVGSTEDGFFALKGKADGMNISGLSLSGKYYPVLEYYTNDFELVNSLEIKELMMPTLNMSKAKLYEFFAQDKNDDLFLYYSELVGDKNTLARKKLDMKSFQLTDKTIVREFNDSGKKLDRRWGYKHTQSKDKSKLAIFSSEAERKGKESYAYVEVFDDELNSLWTMEAILPHYEESVYSNKSFEFISEESTMMNVHNSISLSNDGVLNVMAKAYSDEKEGFLFRRPTDYMHLIYSFSEGNEKPVIRSFPNEKAYIVEMMIQHDKNDNLRLAGFYSNSEKLNVDGLLFLDLNPATLKNNFSKLIEFTDQNKKDFLISSNIDEKKMEKAQKKLDKKMEKGKDVDISARNNLLNLYTHSDNSITMASEFFDFRERRESNRDGNGNVTFEYVTDYIFGDLKFIHISPDGEIEWINNYEKYQKIEDEFLLLSVADFFVEDDIYFVYNDTRSRELKMGTVSKDGKMDSKVITDLKRNGALENYLFMPRTVEQLNENTYVGGAQRIFKKKLVKFTFD